jgi:cellulose synthase/poly-beta-1,6-N-acetylglucosamine synthase-like glycosyltransferase
VRFLGRAHIMWFAAIIGGFLYLAIRATTLGAGWTLALSIPLVVAEVWSFAQLILLAFAAWRITPRTTGKPDVEPLPVDIIIDASLGDLPMLERTLIAADTVDSRAAVIVVDTLQRTELESVAAEFGATYVVDGLAANPATAVLARATTDLYVWLEAGQAPLPNLITATVSRFRDPSVAVCQSAIGLLNADSLVHLQRGRDEDALLRDVLGPGLDRLDTAPWFGPGAIVRRDAVESIGGFPNTGPATVARTLVLLHADGWKSQYQSDSLVRTVAPDTLDDYLRQRRRRMTATLLVFRTLENPLRIRSLSATQRLAHIAMASTCGSGIRQLIVLVVSVATLVTGRLPFEAPLVPLVSLWAVTAGLAALARRQLARGSMSFGDWTRQGWRALGTDLHALLAIRGTAGVAEPHLFPVPIAKFHHRSLPMLTGTATPRAWQR